MTPRFPTKKKDPMPITPEQAAILEAEDRHIRAQVQLYAWMERAEQHQAAADYAMEPEQRTDGSDRIVAHHRAEADRALRFAHAWAEAATALVPPPQPLELIAEAEQSFKDSYAKNAERRGGPCAIDLPQISDANAADISASAPSARS